MLLVVSLPAPMPTSADVDDAGPGQGFLYCSHIGHFADIVDSTRRAAQLGDHAWRDVLSFYYELVRRTLERFQGRELDTAGDGFLASFDGPARAIRCACSITEEMARLGIAVRAGLHTGECEVTDDHPIGIAVHVGARVAALAGPGEVLVSSTVETS